MELSVSKKIAMTQQVSRSRKLVGALFERKSNELINILRLRTLARRGYPRAALYHGSMNQNLEYLGKIPRTNNTGRIRVRIRSVLLCAEIRAVISLKWPVIRPCTVTIRFPTVVYQNITVQDHRIVTEYIRITGHF